MAHLTQIWKDKMDIKKASQRGQNVDLLGKYWTVSWDHPDYKQGEKVTVEKFSTMEEAKDYSIMIGLKYDLRKSEGNIRSMNPNWSRYKSGYSPLPDPHAVAAVWPLIQNRGTWPAEVTELDINEYCQRTNTDRPQHSLPVENRDAMKGHPEYRNPARVKAGPL